MVSIFHNGADRELWKVDLTTEVSSLVNDSANTYSIATDGTTLYAIGNGTSAPNGDVITIDTTTGVATYLTSTQDRVNINFENGSVTGTRTGDVTGVKGFAYDVNTADGSLGTLISSGSTNWRNVDYYWDNNYYVAHAGTGIYRIDSTTTHTLVRNLGNMYHIDSVELTVPEPSSALFLCSGLGYLLMRRRRDAGYRNSIQC